MNIIKNELRIGNLVDLGNRIAKIIEIGHLSCVVVDLEETQDTIEDYNRTKPITLTEEWLFKFGFETIDKGDNDYITYADSEHDYYLQLDVRRKDGKYKILDNSFDDLRTFSMADVIYVHQLQNLYFALTGEELILNNETMIHPEIKCPYCRIQFGHYKIGDKVEHVDMLWTSAAGLIKECQNPELVKSNLESVDKYGNPKFNEDFQKKASELRNKFETCPDDITKENFNADDYMIAFVECMNYGYVDGEDEEYDRENITMPKIQQLWENGHNLNESLKAFIIKNYEQRTDY